MLQLGMVHSGGTCLCTSPSPQGQSLRLGPTLDALACLQKGLRMLKRPRQACDATSVHGRQQDMKKVCRAHQLGGCRFGDSCKFSHEDDNTDGRKPVAAAVQPAAPGQRIFGKPDIDLLFSREISLTDAKSTLRHSGAVHTRHLVR